MTLKAEVIDELESLGISFQSTRDPRKAVCNNCDATISYDIPTNPQALLVTITDSLGGEVFYCPNCGPIDEESLDGVTIE